MKPIRWLLAWVALSMTLASAKELPVEIAPGLTGAFVTPDDLWNGQSVLMLHGFADDMDGAGDLTKRLATELAERGVASLRINFRGEGDKARTQIESTFTTRLEDTTAAYAFLIKQAGVDVKRAGVIGWSLGATTAIQTGAKQSDWFKSMVLWSSPSGNLYTYLTDKEPGKTAMREGVATENVPGWKSITTKREFYESFRGVITEEALARYPGALLSVRGSDDFLPQRDAELIKLVKGRPAEAVLLGGADHIFNVFEPDKGHAARALDVTVAWFLKTL